MKTFETWTCKGAAYLAVQNRDGDGWHIVDEKGENFGAWMTVALFRKLQAKDDPNGFLGIPGSHGIPQIKPYDGEGFKEWAKMHSFEVDIPKQKMKEWISKIRTEFNDGTVFEGDEVQHAIVIAFTAQSRKGVKKTEVIKSEMIPDYE